jgi:hypothetical protein
MGVAGVYAAPGVDDADDRLADEFLMPVAHLQHARTVAEGAKIVDAEPAMAAELFWCLLQLPASSLGT